MRQHACSEDTKVDLFTLFRRSFDSWFSFGKMVHFARVIQPVIVSRNLYTSDKEESYIQMNKEYSQKMVLAETNVSIASCMEMFIVAAQLLILRLAAFVKRYLRRCPQ